MLVRRWDALDTDSEPSAVCRIESRGDYLAWNTDDNFRPDGVGVNVIEVGSVAQVSDKEWRVEIKTEDLLECSLIFRRPVSADERVQYEVVEDICDENEPELTKKLASTLDNAKSLTLRASPNKVFEFSRWLEWRIGGGLQPAGVVLKKPSGDGFLYYPFPGFDTEAERLTGKYSAWRGDTKGMFDEMSASLGRYTTVSRPEQIKASDYNDAVERAMRRFAVDVYNETGEKVFG